jgi:hypothetical protein
MAGFEIGLSQSKDIRLVVGNNAGYIKPLVGEVTWAFIPVSQLK